MEILQQLIKSRAVNLDPPAHFEKGNIEAVFGMMDPTRRGIISFEQYKAGTIQTLRIKFKYSYIQSWPIVTVQGLISLHLWMSKSVAQLPLQLFRRFFLQHYTLCTGMMTLGVKNYAQNPPGYDVDKISADTFGREA